MITAHTPETLRAFEQEIADLFNAGRIPFPIHLHGGNEAQLFDVFRDVGPDDWVATNWRSHYHCLLKGVPPDELRTAIMDGHSITLNFPRYRIVSSAIVGGVLPIALGIAWEVKRRGGSERVHCFMGDMTAETGMFCECFKYAVRHELPVRWIIESNGKSVCTDSAAAWGGPLMDWSRNSAVTYFSYDPVYPHSGAGVRVEF